MNRLRYIFVGSMPAPRIERGDSQTNLLPAIEEQENDDMIYEGHRRFRRQARPVKMLPKRLEKVASSKKYWSWKAAIFLLSGIVVTMSIVWMVCLLSLSGINVCPWFDSAKGSNSCVPLFGHKRPIAPKSNEQSKKITLQSSECAIVSKEDRFDCHPENGASQLACTNRDCCWDPIENNSGKVPLNYPYCFYPKGWSRYKLLNGTKDTIFMENSAPSSYRNDAKLVKATVESNPRFLRFRIVDAEKKRYEPHLPIVPVSEENVENPFFSLEKLPEDAMGFRVKKTSDNMTMVKVVPEGFIFSDQFIQISMRLTSTNIYGLGEHRTNLRLSTKWQSLTMFNKDQPPTENANLYGSHPFLMVIDPSGLAFGILLLNSNAMDIILQPAPAITYRSIGGIFDFFIITGPTPEDVVKGYSSIVGKPFMPPYWSLGFHLCRYGYGSLEKTREVWNRTRAAGIPFDTQWNDLDYMKLNKDFTYNTENFKDLPKFVDEIHKAGMHYIPLIDAGISSAEENGTYRPYEQGILQDVFVKDGDTNLPFQGRVWNLKSTVWPDFTNPSTAKYWYEMMSEMYRMFPYDGAWIDMNEPSNFNDGKVGGCGDNPLDNPEYLPNAVGNLLATKTMCMNAKFHLGSHYDVHNTYGTSEAVATNQALTKIRGLRPFVISRSTWVGHGHYAGHWSGDVYSSWHDMRMSVPQLLSFSLFQVPIMGADICGFDGNTTQALCNRWSQLGAFYPFSRNHNSDDTIEQDPVAMGELVVKSARKALMIRYRFLPHLYTLMFRAHMFGETVARPLFFEFYNDSETYGIDSQFLWGSSFMILPVFEEGATQVVAYLPRGIWYDFYDKSAIKSSGQNFTVQAPLDTIPLLIRAGIILPAQTPGKTTTESRKNSFELLIAPDDLGQAKGELYWDDGDSLDSIEKSNYRWLKFALANQSVSCQEVEPGKYADDMILGKVQIMGIVKEVTKVSINGVSIGFNYDKRRSYLTVKNLQVDMKEKFSLSWE